MVRKGEVLGKELGALGTKIYLGHQLALCHFGLRLPPTKIMEINEMKNHLDLYVYFYVSKTVEGLRFCSPCNSLVGPPQGHKCWKRHEIPGPETKDIIAHGVAGNVSFVFRMGHKQSDLSSEGDTIPPNSKRASPAENTTGTCRGRPSDQCPGTCSPQQRLSSQDVQTHRKSVSSHLLSSLTVQLSSLPCPRHSPCEHPHFSLGDSSPLCLSAPPSPRCPPAGTAGTSVLKRGHALLVVSLPTHLSHTAV